jgi:RNA polymerase sigma factor for flagellar operon FliA
VKGRDLHEYCGHSVLDRKALFEDNVLLVKRIANHVSIGIPAGVQKDDLVQVGLISLYEAAQNFVDTGVANFRTYATTRVRGAMIDELRRTSWAPRSLQKQQKQISEAVRVLEQREGRPASEREIAEELGLPMAEYLDILQQVSGASLLSIDDEVSGFDVVSGAEGHDAELQKEEILRILAELIEKLPDKEKLVIALYFDEELNLKEIGSVLDVSESRISQILSQALSRLRSRMALRMSPTRSV